MSEDACHSGPANEIPQNAGIDLTAALGRLGGDAELMRDLARIVIEDAPGLLQQALLGSSAADREAGARAAHGLKGLLSNFSESAASAAQAAESAIRQGDSDRRERSLQRLGAYVDRLTLELQKSVLRD